jgi:hypothetical protein
MVLLTDFGPRVIRTFGEHRGPIMGISPKLADLVHFGQFSMVLITDLGPQVYPDFRGTPGSAYRNLAKTRRFGPFWPVFYGITH